MGLYKKSATELSQMLAAKECSSVELVKSLLGRIEATDEKVGAYLTVCGDDALANAAEVDAKRAKGEALHKIAGIPVSLKDIICTNGVKTTCASKMLENFIPPYDATVVSRIKSNGGIIAGKLNMDEFAMGSSCETSAFKPTRNSRDLERVPGGSSGGSAASVAAGSAILTLGTDTGGSIRQPASFSGIVGLKPTYGSVSRYGVVAFASSLDQVGPMTRTVKDAALLYDVISGKDEMDTTSVHLKCDDFTATMGRGVKGLRIGIPSEYFGEGVTDEVKHKVMAAVKCLELEGAIIKPVSLPSTGYALAAYYIIACAEASSNLARFDGIKYGYRAKEFDSLIDLYERSRSEAFGDEVKRRIMLGSYVLSSGFFDAYYNRAKLLQKRIAAEFAAAFLECDVLATPTSPSTAFKLGENVDDPLKMYAADICTINVNIAGIAAISVPCGYGADGLPIGLQFIGPKFSEPCLFNVADHYESLFGGFNVVSEI